MLSSVPRDFLSTLVGFGERKTSPGCSLDGNGGLVNSDVLYRFRESPHR